jgi:hypothetical protein
VRRITTRSEFVNFSRDMGVRPDWHEPDEQELTARVEGRPLDFDNAGFWPASESYHAGEFDQHTELHVIFSRKETDEQGAARRGPDLACVNLATLCAWATGYEGEG